jgi:hypothetical protein
MFVWASNGSREYVSMMCVCVCVCVCVCACVRVCARMDLLLAQYRLLSIYFLIGVRGAQHFLQSDGEGMACDFSFPQGRRRVACLLFQVKCHILWRWSLTRRIRIDLQIHYYTSRRQLLNAEAGSVEAASFRYILYNIIFKRLPLRAR